MRKVVVMILMAAFVCNTQTACSSSADEEIPIGNVPTENPNGNTDNSNNPDEHATYEVRTLKLLSNNNGKRIYGIVYLPEGKNGKMPTAIYSHGFGGTNSTGSAYARSLAEHGYACYCFDFCGGSSSSRSDGKTTDMSIFTERSDLEAVIVTIKQQEFTDTDNLFLIGASQGGMVSAMTAAAHPEEIKGLMLLYPAFCIADDAHHRFLSLEDVPATVNLMGMTIGRVYYERLFDFDTYATVTTYPKDVLIVHGDKDGTVPISYSQNAISRYPSAILETLSGAGHGFYGDNQTKATNYILDYISNHIK